MAGAERAAYADSEERGRDASLTDEATVRERVWDATLTLLYRRPLPFQTWRIQVVADLDESHSRTIRRTLSNMADAGWLDHEPNSKWWHPGPKVDERFGCD